MQRRAKWSLGIAGLILLLILSIVVALSCGEIAIPTSKLWELLSQPSESMEKIVLTKIRGPRVALAIFVGGSLSLAGVILQGIYRNPLVEPYTLGISGGGALGVSIIIILGLQSAIGSLTMPLAGFIGALVTTLFVYTLGLKNRKIHVNQMLLAGVMISFITSSALMLIMSLVNSDDLQGIVFWTMGSLDNPNPELLELVGIVSIAGLLLSYIYAQPLNAMRLGRERAIHLGIDADKKIKQLFVVSSLVTGLCVSVVGIIGFIGLIIPHLTRKLFGTDFRILFLASFLGGAIFLLLSDTIARTILAPNELPVGVITGLIGGVFFLTIMFNSSKK